MEHDFWHTVWETGRTGWRQSEPGPRLRAHWSAIDVPANGTILVPLCGDSPDMRWLLDQGHRVVGCDLSELGLTRFMTDNTMKFERFERESFVELVGPGIRLLAGDFMALTPTDIGPVNAVYDRAATIALPPPMRRAYVEHLATLIDPGVQSLLIAINYDETEMKGPPFSVPNDEVTELFSDLFEVHILDASSNSDLAGRLKDRGLTQLTETTYRIKRRP